MYLVFWFRKICLNETSLIPIRIQKLLAYKLVTFEVSVRLSVQLMDTAPAVYGQGPESGLCTAGGEA